MNNEERKASHRTIPDSNTGGGAVAFICLSLLLLVPVWLVLVMPSAADTERMLEDKGQHWVEENRTSLARFEELAWETFHEDRFIALESGDPGVERCHYIMVPSGDLAVAEDNLDMEPGEFAWRFRVYRNQTKCEHLPYDPETGEVG